MSALNQFMSRGFVSPQAHGVLDYPLAAILVAGPLVRLRLHAGAVVLRDRRRVRAVCDPRDTLRVPHARRSRDDVPSSA
jgi:hypothetical protein